MDFNLIWQAALIIVVGTVLLRIVGRKSVSQMTVAQTVLMIAIGTLLIQPVTNKNIWVTFGIGIVLVITLLTMEYIQLKLDGAEKILTGKSKVIIENGQIKEENLKKLKLTVDQLEMNLRQKNVMRVSDVKWATMEVDGKIGFTLKEDAQPVTKKEFKHMQNDVQQVLNLLRANPNPTSSPVNEQQMNPLNPPKQANTQPDIFTEVDQDGHKNPPPKHLQ